MPEHFLKKLKSAIRPQWKVCFLSALIVGFLAHFYKISNWLPNWDSLVFRYDAQNMIGLGRWFLPVVCSVSSFFDLPFLNGILCVLFHALGAVVILNIFKVKNNITAALIGATVISFPTVTSVLMYNYVADGYAFSFFISCLAAELVLRKKPRYIISVILIALSSGIYQAYITVTITLIIAGLTDDFIFGGEKISDTLKKALKCLFTGGAGMVLYYAMLKLLLFVSGSELADYQGINSALSPANIDILSSLYLIKDTFLKFFFGSYGKLSLFVILNVAIFLFSVICYVAYCLKKKKKSSLGKLIFLIFALIFFVLGGTALAFINAGVEYHNLMLMGYCTFYIMFIILYERGKDKNKKHTLVKSWTVFVLSLLLIFNQILISNICYHKAQMAYEKSYGTLIRIADRIEQTENSDKSNRLMVIGALEGSEGYSAVIPPEITGVTDGFIIRADDESVGQSVFTSTINDYCGKNYEFVYGKEKDDLLRKEEIKNMPVWPEAGCILVTDDITVINFGVEREK